VKSSDRRKIGQLLIQMTRLFRKDLFARLSEEPGLEGIRPSHLHVFANMVGGGKRLTELADAASMSLPSMQELVDDLGRRGIVERQLDPRDRRAKLIVLTDKGLDALAPAASIIEALEHEYAERIGEDRFEDMCLALDALIDDLLERDDGHPARARQSGRR
jgi:DNA-binding MarR family transcriptional regulator